jgi:hypothetical protein
VDVAVGWGVRVSVLVGRGVLVAVGVGVRVGVAVGCGVWVEVSVALGSGVGVYVTVAVGCRVGVEVDVALGSDVGVWVEVGVGEGDGWLEGSWAAATTGVGVVCENAGAVGAAVLDWLRLPSTNVIVCGVVPWIVSSVCMGLGAGGISRDGTGVGEGGCRG